MSILERERMQANLITQNGFFPKEYVPLFNEIAQIMQKEGLGNVGIRTHPNQYYDWMDQPPVQPERIHLLITYESGWNDRNIFWNIADATLEYRTQESPKNNTLSKFINGYSRKLRRLIATGQLQSPFPRGAFR